MRIIRKNSEKLLIESFIREFKKISKNKELKKKRLSFVLTGGSSPVNLYKKLSKVNLNWKNIDFFWGDERYVSNKSIHSNYCLANKTLFKYINIKNKQIFPVNTAKPSAKKSSLDYSNKIKRYFGKKKISFDIFLLGMGNDGHIASIFPNDLQKKSNKITRSVLRNDFERITINLKKINNSKFIFLWLNTKKKVKNFFKIRNNNNKQIPVNNIKRKNIVLFLLSKF